MARDVPLVGVGFTCLHAAGSDLFVSRAMLVPEIEPQRFEDALGQPANGTVGQTFAHATEPARWINERAARGTSLRRSGGPFELVEVPRRSNGAVASRAVGDGPHGAAADPGELGDLSLAELARVQEPSDFVDERLGNHGSTFERLSKRKRAGPPPETIPATGPWDTRSIQALPIPVCRATPRRSRGRLARRDEAEGRILAREVCDQEDFLATPLAWGSSTARSRSATTRRSSSVNGPACESLRISTTRR